MMNPAELLDQLVANPTMVAARRRALQVTLARREVEVFGELTKINPADRTAATNLGWPMPGNAWPPYRWHRHRDEDFMTEQHTRDTVRVIRGEGDFGSWLASVLATATADKDGGDPIGPRLRGWEAQHVECLTEGGQVIADAMPAVDVVHGAVSADIAVGLSSLDAMADEYAASCPRIPGGSPMRRPSDAAARFAQAATELLTAAPAAAQGHREFTAKWGANR
ncbi:hypothetical protein [Microbispora sp. CA-102843]|uniref:hypothetical protein n=1 Tax=Microbispora sp. CA-102843 TaxID=3239952 RepID=UPI003D9062E1